MNALINALLEEIFLLQEELGRKTRARAYARALKLMAEHEQRLVGELLRMLDRGELRQKAARIVAQLAELHELR